MIEAERQRLDVARFLKHIATQIGEREAALCAISVAELAHGIHRADTSERRQARRAFLDDLKAMVPVNPITGETAELLGKAAEQSAVSMWQPLKTGGFFRHLLEYSGDPVVSKAHPKMPVSPNAATKTVRPAPSPKLTQNSVEICSCFRVSRWTDAAFNPASWNKLKKLVKVITMLRRP